MHPRHAESVARLAQSAQYAPGATDHAFRLAVQQWATATRSTSQATDPAPIHPLVAAYVDKVSRHAYLVTDEDVAALKAAGYSEDAIFEITVAAAVAAGLDR